MLTRHEALRARFNAGLRRRLAPLLAVVLAVAFFPRDARTQSGGIQFADGTAYAGIAFRHNSGAFGKKYLSETMGSGLALFDYDNDGWLDVFFANETEWPGQPGPPTSSTLYRNDRDGTFTDVTKAAGLATPMFAIGVTAADYDNDGWKDLYVTAIGGNHLFRNLGNGTFADVTAKSGTKGPGTFGTSAMFFDYDRDGLLDIVIANYVTWTVDKDLFCTLDGKTKSYCTPESYKGESPTLFRNRGDGTFEDATRKAGLWDPTSKALGVALLDHDEDGWPDFVLANDTQPNKLYRNNQDGTFTDVGTTAGIAFGETGVARAGMGVDTADYSGVGRASLLVANFANEMIGLYHNEGNGLYVDEAPASTVGRASMLTLAFGIFFFDYDLDGRLDIFAGNGHVADDIAEVQPSVTHAQLPHVFRNAGDRRFEPVARTLGPALQKPIVARGVANGDVDNDGDLDVLVSTNDGPAVLFRNDGGNRNRFVRVKTIGTRSNRDGIGAKVTVTLGGRSRQWRLVHTGSSYCSQSDTALTFGLGATQRVESIEVVWPSGQVDRTGPVVANQVAFVEEGRGLVSAKVLPAKGAVLAP